MFDAKFRLTWNESVAQFAETLPWQLIALAIAFGTAIVVWAIVYFGDCCLGRRQSKHYELDKGKYDKKTRRCGSSVIRLSIIVSAIVVGTIGFWIACNTAGVSFWNILVAYGISTLVMTYSFGSALQSAGSYFLIALTNKITEDIYLEFIGMPGVEGHVTAINILWVELEYIDPQSGKFRDVFVPTTYIISSIYFRNYGKEAVGAPALTMDTASRVGHKLKRFVV